MTAAKKQRRVAQKISDADARFFVNQEGIKVDAYMLEVEMAFFVCINTPNRPETYQEIFEAHNKFWMRKCHEYNNGPGKRNQFVHADKEFFARVYGPEETYTEPTLLNRLNEKLRQLTLCSK